MAKTGRPKTHLEPYSIKSLVLADSYWARLSEVSATKGITRADLIRQILIDALERNFQDNITN
jgi:predicted DNA-binding ribbon-helix-helix protein